MSALADLLASVGLIRVQATRLDAVNRTIGLAVDGGGATITTGQKGYVQVPFAGRIIRWVLLADQVGSCVVDVWKTTFALAPPTAPDSICAYAKPTLSAAIKAEGSGWNVAVKAGDVVGFNVDSASGIQRMTLNLWVDV